MKQLRSLVIALVFSTSGSALAYDSFTVGLQGEVFTEYGYHVEYVAYGAHAVLPVARFSAGTHPAVLSLRADLSVADVTYIGLAAVMSGSGTGIQPFASLGAGTALLGAAPPEPAFQGLLGARIPLAHGFYRVVQLQLRIATTPAAFPGAGAGVEYSF
jgi:hypothetical protein